MDRTFYIHPGDMNFARSIAAEVGALPPDTIISPRGETFEDQPVFCANIVIVDAPVQASHVWSYITAGDWMKGYTGKHYAGCPMP